MEFVHIKIGKLQFAKSDFESFASLRTSLTMQNKSDLERFCDFVKILPFLCKQDSEYQENLKLIQFVQFIYLHINLQWIYYEHFNINDYLSIKCTSLIRILGHQISIYQLNFSSSSKSSQIIHRSHNTQGTGRYSENGS